MHHFHHTFILSLFLLFISSTSIAKDSHQLDEKRFSFRYQSELVTKGISIPWAMAQLPSGELLVTERSGKLFIYSKKSLGLQQIDGLPEIAINGQGGLLDIALHPNYSQEPWIYFTYSSSSGSGRGSNTALARAKLDLTTFTLTDLELLYKAQANSSSGRHYGSRIAFDDKGHVYFSIGDRGDRDNNPQDLTRDGGKIYRLFLNGDIPKSNPFYSAVDAKAAIYSYGHRNPQGLVFTNNTKQLWSHEHGPRGGDELNLVHAGKNYGWPIISYGINYSGTKFTELTHKAGMEQPSLYWDPSIAPSGLIQITSNNYPELKGKFLLGSMKFGYIVVVSFEKNKVTSQSQLLKGIGRVRSLLQGSDGYIYIGIDGGGIRKLVLKK